MTVNLYKEIECVECGGKIKSRLTDGNEIYPHRSDLKSKKFWKCDHCGNYVGCHPNSDNNPLGFIPSTEIRKARREIHAILDPLWRSKKISRGKAYKYISNRIGYQYHNGELKNIKEARRAYKIVAELHNKLNKQLVIPNSN